MRWSGRGSRGGGGRAPPAGSARSAAPACRGVSPSRGSSGQGQVAEVLGREDLAQPSEDAGTGGTDAADRHAQAGADVLVADRRRCDQQLDQLPVPVGELGQRSTDQYLVLLSQRGRL